MKIDDSALFFTCSLLELMGRITKQKPRDIVTLTGEKNLRHIYQHADTLHCEPIAKTADFYIDFCNIPVGNFDNVASCKYAVPTYWDIGKVYARLIEDIAEMSLTPGQDVISLLSQVYNSSVSDSISNFNSDFFYQPRDYIKEFFLEIYDNASKKPAVRFAGFTDPWEQRKLGEMVDFRRGLTYSPSDVSSDGIRVLRSSNIDEDTFMTSDDDVFVKVTAINIPFSEKGDILITGANGSSRLVGKHALIPEHQGKMVHGGFMLLAHPHKHSGFINSLMSAPWYITFINTYIAGGNGAIGNLNKSDLEMQNIFVPKDKEQSKIGQFFHHLDDLIALHQRKYDKLVNVKKSMLEKLFPKNGSDVPEVRFSGFSDAWEQRRLGEIGKTYTGLSGKTKDDFGHGSAKFVPYLNVFSNPITDPNDLEYVKIDSKQNTIQRGDVFFTTSSETPDEVGMSSVFISQCPANTYLNSFCFGYRLEQPIDLYYLAYFFRADIFRKSVIFLAQGISRYNISKNRVMELPISIPDIKEQEKIGKIFHHLDDLIALHQRKLEKLKKMKKSCLEKMFV